MQQVTLSFNGKSHTVPAEKSWGLIEAIEDVVTMAWLAPRLQDKQIPLVKIYRAYAAALQYAGAGVVTIDQIREGIDYRRGLEMAYEMAAILSLASPPIDLKIGRPLGDKEVAKVKKKQTVK